MKHGGLYSIPVSEPWEVVGVDVVGPIGDPTKRGNRYIIVFTDYLTKWAEAVCVASISSIETAKALIECVILRHGVPR